MRHPGGGGGGAAAVAGHRWTAGLVAVVLVACLAPAAGRTGLGLRGQEAASALSAAAAATGRQAHGLSLRSAVASSASEASTSAAAGAERAVHREAAEGLGGKPTPIQRVVQLLEEMRGQLEKEGAAEQETYDKMACWCETNDKDKTKAIADGELRISQLESEVGERSGRAAELATNIGKLKEDLAQKKESLQQAVALREKEHAAFNDAEVDMVEAVTMLGNAIVVLTKHHNNTGLLQMKPAVQQSLGTALRWVALKHDEMLELKAEHAAATDHLDSLRGASVRQPTQSSGAALLALQGAAKASAASGALLQSLLDSEQSTQLPAEFAARVLAAATAEEATTASSSSSQGGGAVALTQERLNQPAPFQSYSPQSGQIFGILKQMKDDFEANLSKAQKEELKAREEFAELKVALEKEIETGAVKLDEMEVDAAGNAKALSDAKEDLGITRDTRSSDVQFLSDLRLKCQDLDHQWKQRSKTRGEEMQAVSEAISILTEDDARDLFHKKMGTGSGGSFVQVASEAGARTFAEAALRSRASALLAAAAQRLGPGLVVGQRGGGGGGGGGGASAWRRNEDDPQNKLAVMAVQVQLDAFSKVKAAIDSMVSDLKTQQEKEVKHKAFCTKSLNDNEMETYTTKETLEDLADTITSLEHAIERLDLDIAEAKKAIAKMQVEVKRAGELRAEENKEFQEEVTDQRAMQEILGKAIHRMELVYKDSSFLQQRQEPPVHFQPYSKNSGGHSVISLMEQIVEDSKRTEQEALSAENAAQSAYEGFVKDSYASIRSLTEAIGTKTKTMAQTKEEKAEKVSAHQDTQTRLDMLANVAGDVHDQCDFVLKNFDIRQTARLQEIEALGSVKALLSGMDPRPDVPLD